MNKVKTIALELILFLLAVLFLSSFVWYPRQPAVSLNPAQDPILAKVSETSAAIAEYENRAAAVPAEAKLDYAYARPWLEKSETAVSYSDALPLLYAQRLGNWPPIQPTQAPLMDLTYPQQYGTWPHTH